MTAPPPGLSGLLSLAVKRRRIRQAVARLAPGDRVLDLGSGLGEIVESLPPGVAYLGVERDPYMVDRCRDRFPGMKFLRADFLEEPLPAGPWDAVLLLAVLEHLARPEELLDRARAVLAPGGRIIATTPHPRGRGILETLARVGLLSSFAEEEHERLLDRGALEAAGRAAGLRLVDYTTFLAGLNQCAVFRGADGGDGP